MHLGPQAISKTTHQLPKFVCPVFAILFFMVLPAWGAKDKHEVTPAGPKLTLRVYNYAGLDASTLTSSEKVATAIFRGVGIDPAWVDCPTSKPTAVVFQACDSPMGPADFVLRILPQSMANKARHSQEALGFAQICSVSEPACELNILYYRVDELAT